MTNAIMIGGAPGAGKTTLTRALAGALEFDGLSADDLVRAATAITTVDSHPDFHPTRGRSHLEYFTESSPDELIGDAVRLENAAWPAVRRVIEGRIRGAGVVMDWWLFHPAKLAAMDNQAVVPVWLGIDPAALDRRERRVVDFRRGSTNPERMHANFMARSLWRDQLVRREAARHGQLLLEQPGHRDVTDLVSAVLAHIEVGQG